MENVCRICLGNSNLLDIFGSDEEIASNIMLFAAVQITEGDIYPQQICDLCKVELDICLSFKNKCEATFKTLQNSLNTARVDQLKRINQDEPKTEFDSETCSENFFEGASRPVIVNCKKWGNCEHRKDQTQLFKHPQQISNILERTKQCDICGKCFKYNAELKRHSLTHSGTKVYDCKHCNKKFSSKGGLNKHTVRYSKTRRLPCPLCPKMFIHQSNLSDHIKVHSNQRKYNCQICSKSFKAKRTLILHLKIHRNERDSPCLQCDKAFTNKYDLIRHSKLHERLKVPENEVYHNHRSLKVKTSSNGKQCELCGKCCRNVSDLKKHVRVHTNERPYICPHCEKTFKSTSSLNCHIRIHTQEKPYVCKLCGKGFAQSSNLRTHETIHSIEKPFKCCVCTSSFGRRRDLQRHLKKCGKIISKENL